MIGVQLTVNDVNVSYVKNLPYLAVIFDRKITRGTGTEMKRRTFAPLLETTFCP